MMIKILNLKVVLDDNDDLIKGQEIAKDLMKQLGVDDDCLLSGAYLDMQTLT